MSNHTSAYQRRRPRRFLTFVELLMLVGVSMVSFSIGFSRLEDVLDNLGPINGVVFFGLLVLVFIALIALQPKNHYLKLVVGLAGSGVATVFFSWCIQAYDEQWRAVLLLGLALGLIYGLAMPSRLAQLPILLLMPSIMVPALVTFLSLDIPSSNYTFETINKLVVGTGIVGFTMVVANTYWTSD